MSISSRITSITLAVTAAASLVLAQQPSTDWTQWRGPNRDGNATTFTPPAVWPDTLVQKWKVEVGTGYASPIVVGDRVYVFSRRGTNEGMSAHDGVTGRELWRFGYEAPFTMNSASARHNAGPKSTPVFAHGRLLSIGMTGVVTAWDAATGRTLWQKPGSEPLPMYTTHAFSPIVEGDLAVFHLGGHDQGAVTAFDIASGNQRWRWAGDGPSYGSPIVATIGGTKQVITITQTKVVGVDVGTGALLWERPFVHANVGIDLWGDFLRYGRNTEDRSPDTLSKELLALDRQLMLYGNAGVVNAYAAFRALERHSGTQHSQVRLQVARVIMEIRQDYRCGDTGSRRSKSYSPCSSPMLTRQVPLPRYPSYQDVQPRVSLASSREERPCTANRSSPASCRPITGGPSCRRRSRISCAKTIPRPSCIIVDDGTEPVAGTAADRRPHPLRPGGTQGDGGCEAQSGLRAGAGGHHRPLG